MFTGGVGQSWATYPNNAHLPSAKVLLVPFPARLTFWNDARRKYFVMQDIAFGMFGIFAL